MNILPIVALGAAVRVHRPRRPNSVRPRFKSPEKTASQSAAVSQPPSVGGETFAYCPDWDEAMAARYAQEGHPLATLVRLRLEAARHVEALLAFLDATEGDIDLGDDDAEPTLEAIRNAASLCNDSTDDDEDGADSEPWLASPEPLTTHEDEYWFPYRSQDARQDIHEGVTDDRELDESDDEPSLCGVTATAIPNHTGVEDGEQEAEDEPSLGSVEGGYDGIGHRSMGQQERWAQGGCSDLEDSGLGNDDRESDGLDEGEHDESDREPSLGWPEGHIAQGQGMLGRSSDVEQGQFVQKPKGTTPLKRKLFVECSYRRFVHGLSQDQKAMMSSRMDRDAWIILR